MRKIAFIIGILGLGILVSFLVAEPFLVDNLDGLIVGDVVSISGVVEEQRNFGTGKLLIVEDIPVFCECVEDYSGFEVIVSGVVEYFQDLRIRAFTVEKVDKNKI